MKIILKQVERVFDEFLKIDRAVIQFEKFDGTMTDDIVRFTMNRGDSVAALLLNRDTHKLIFTKQFRYPAYAHDEKNGWLLEIVAGIIEHNNDPDRTIINEIYEEVGYQVSTVEKIRCFYTTPGSNSEQVHLYYAEVTNDQKINEGGGLDRETEYIQAIEMPIEDAFQLLDRNEIKDAKTIIALQWLRAKNNDRRSAPFQKTI